MISHEVNVISVLTNLEGEVLIQRAPHGQWGFVGSEDLRPGEQVSEVQRRGLERDLPGVSVHFDSVLHLESYPAGTVGPRSKFGVFLLCSMRPAEPRLEPSESRRWVQHVSDLDGMDLIHERVRDLCARALAGSEA